MHLSATFALLLASSAALAHPRGRYVIHEKRSMRAAQSLTGKSVPDAGHVLPFRIALTQPNHDQIPLLLDSVADPRSPDFGKHWSGDELARKFAPSGSSATAVKAWLAAAGIEATNSANGHWVEFQASVAAAERLLRTRYFAYNNVHGKSHLGCDHYSIPYHLSSHIDFIMPTVNVGMPKDSLQKRRIKTTENDRSANVQLTTFKIVQTKAKGAQVKGEAAAAPESGLGSPSVGSCASGATPDCIRALYGVPKGHTAAADNAFGLYESGDYYDQADLDSFFSQHASDIPRATAPTLNSINGGRGPSSNATERVSGESVLDLQIAYPLIYPQKVRLLQTDDPTTDNSPKEGHFDSLLDALDAEFCTFAGGDNSTFDFTYPNNSTAGGYNGTKMCGTYKPPTVISISYGFLESDFSPAYLKRQCLEFGKLALAGTTVVVSSGDSGISAPYCANPVLHVASPQFPASCPFVTTVGATMLDTKVSSLTDGNVEIMGEDEVGDFKAGSGFSSVFDMPTWQQATVPGYLSALAANQSNSTARMDPTKNFNATGRAYPDVAALGTNITTITNQQPFIADGTSASAPLFASLITLINEERFAAGKGPVGFINPALYQAAGADESVRESMFRDVVQGSNGGCGMAGFAAAKGWDAVTGWGTPKWQGLRDVLVELP